MTVHVFINDGRNVIEVQPTSTFALERRGQGTSGNIINEQSGPQIKEYCTTHGNVPKDYGSYLRPKTFIQHTHTQPLTTRIIMKALTATGWGKQMETLMATYKAVMRPALECAFSI